MTKSTLIIAIIILGLAYHYYQNQVKDNSAIAALQEKKITDLENSLLNLAQQKIKDNKDWEIRYNELEELNNQQAREQKQVIKELQDQARAVNQTYLAKISALETQLFTLAKQKIKGQKEAERLVNELETNRKADKEYYEQLLDNYHQQEQHLLRELAQKKQELADQTITPAHD